MKATLLCYAGVKFIKQNLLFWRKLTPNHQLIG